MSLFVGFRRLSACHVRISQPLRPDYCTPAYGGSTKDACTVKYDEPQLEFCWPYGESSRFPWMRMRVNEPGAFELVRRERRFDLAEFAPNFRFDDAELGHDMQAVHWPDCDSHEPTAWLESCRPDAREPANQTVIVQELWSDLHAGSLPHQPAGGNQMVFLFDLKRFGLALVHGLDEDPGAVHAFGVFRPQSGNLFRARTRGPHPTVSQLPCKHIFCAAASNEPARFGVPAGRPVFASGARGRGRLHCAEQDVRVPVKDAPR